MDSVTVVRGRGFGPVRRQQITPVVESLARQVDLALVCQRLKLSNFFMHAPHTGRICFHVGHSPELQELPVPFRRSRLRLTYSVEAGTRGQEYWQTVELMGPFFRQTLDAVGGERPHSRISSIAWRWICPNCEEPTNL